MHLPDNYRRFSSRFEITYFYLKKYLPYIVVLLIVEQTSERECSYENEQKCTVKFVYGFGADGSRRVRVQREPICPQPVPALAIGLGLLAAILIAGLLLLLIYKITTYLYDKREYARFLEERKKAKWNAVIVELKNLSN